VSGSADDRGRVQDASFTCTLFAPPAEFAQLRDRESILTWFRRYFADAVDLIGEEEVVHDIKQNPRSLLISIKANPYHYKDRVIILGDAAHSMVPFYGQGLNCGFEDVRVLSSLMTSHAIDGTVPLHSEKDPDWVDNNLAAVMREYSDCRHEDLVAICDLAMQNYIEMRHSVTTRLFRVRKLLDSWLSRAFPSPRAPSDSINHSNPPIPNSGPAPHRSFPRGWLSLYTMVTFRPDIPYAVAQAKSEWQTMVLGRASWVLGNLTALGIAYGVYISYRGRGQ